MPKPFSSFLPDSACDMHFKISCPETSQPNQYQAPRTVLSAEKAANTTTRAKKTVPSTATTIRNDCKKSMHSRKLSSAASTSLGRHCWQRGHGNMRPQVDVGVRTCALMWSRFGYGASCEGNGNETDACGRIRGRRDPREERDGGEIRRLRREAPKTIHLVDAELLCMDFGRRRFCFGLWLVQFLLNPLSAHHTCFPNLLEKVWAQVFDVHITRR